jgi:hypothetical protein
MRGYSPSATHIPVIWGALARIGDATKPAHLFSNLLHVPDDEVVAFWVVESGKAPGVLEGDEIGLLRVEVKVNCPKASNLFACHWRAVYALLEVWW